MRVEILKPLASTARPVAELRRTAEASFDLDSTEGCVSFDVMVRKVGPDPEPPKDPEPVQQQAPPRTRRHEAAARTKAYLDEHELRPTIDAMTKQASNRQNSGNN